MPNYNKVVLMGHTTKMPDLKTTPNGITFANCGIAVNNYYKDKKDTMFIDFTCFGKIAENLQMYVPKGSCILIEGRLNLNTWESEGQKKSKHDIIVESFVIVNNKSKPEEESTEQAVVEEDVPEKTYRV